MILFSIISVSQTPQSHVLPSILAQASGKPVFLKLTLGSPGKRLACVVAQKVRAVTFMCCDGSNDDRRWILRIRVVTREAMWGQVCGGRFRRWWHLYSPLLSAPLLHLSPQLCEEDRWCRWRDELGGSPPNDACFWGAVWRGGGTRAQRPAGAVDTAAQPGHGVLSKGDARAFISRTGRYFSRDQLMKTTVL